MIKAAGTTYPEKQDCLAASKAPLAAQVHWPALATGLALTTTIQALATTTIRVAAISLVPEDTTAEPMGRTATPTPGRASQEIGLLRNNHPLSRPCRASTTQQRRTRLAAFTAPLCTRPPRSAPQVLTKDIPVALRVADTVSHIRRTRRL